jgi:putative transposase
MKKSTFTEEQIIAVLKRADSGEPVAEVCRQAGISDSTFYRWKAKYDGLEVNELKRLKHLEDENRRLKQIVADLTLDNTARKDVLAKKW